MSGQLDKILETIDRVAKSNSRLTRIADSVLQRVVPKTTAKAVCYYEYWQCSACSGSQCGGWAMKGCTKRHICCYMDSTGQTTCSSTTEDGFWLICC